MIDFEKHHIRTLLLDMDGVLWKDAQPIGNLPAVFERIKGLGLNAVLATNNATRSTEQYLEKLSDLGVELEPWQIATAGHACVYYLDTHYGKGTRVHVMGEPGLMSTIENAGYTLADSSVKVVIVGVDRSVSYKRIEMASTLIRQGAEFLGTNPDKTFPTPHGLIPGAGSIIAAVATAAEIDPLFIGKPNRFLLDLALERVNGSMSEALMVGDRLETDILAAQNAGCMSCLVMSGVTTPALAQAWQPQPDFITADLAELVGA